MPREVFMLKQFLREVCTKIRPNVAQHWGAPPPMLRNIAGHLPNVVQQNGYVLFFSPNVAQHWGPLRQCCATLVADFAVPETQTSARIPYLWGAYACASYAETTLVFAGVLTALKQKRLRKAGVAAPILPTQLLDTVGKQH